MRIRERRGREPDPTREDLGRLAWAVLIVELVAAGLAAAARGYVGTRAAVWIGLGLGGLALVAFALVVAFSLGVSYAGEWLVRRRERRARHGRPPTSRGHLGNSRG